jgi:hypothetical protein
LQARASPLGDVVCEPLWFPGASLRARMSDGTVVAVKRIRELLFGNHQVA